LKTVNGYRRPVRFHTQQLTVLVKFTTLNCYSIGVLSIPYIRWRWKRKWNDCTVFLLLHYQQLLFSWQVAFCWVYGRSRQLTTTVNNGHWNFIMSSFDLLF